MTLPGIPCLYYGTEFSLLDAGGKIGEDGETGRMMFFPHKGGPIMKEVEKSQTFSDISKLAALRKKLPVLRTGKWIPLWVDSASGDQDDGVFAFARASEDGESFVVVVVNASDAERTTSDGDNQIQLPASMKTAGKVLRRTLTIGQEKSLTPADIDAAAPLRLAVPPSSLVIYESFPSEK